MADPESTPAERFLRSDALLLRGKWTTKWLWLAALVLLGAVAAWWTTHPEGFGRHGRVELETPAGRPIFVGVLGPSTGSGRTIRISDVTAQVVQAPTGTEVVGLICRGGAIGFTSDANAFCTELAEANGETLHYGNATLEQLVLRITSPNPGLVEIDGADLTFRDGLQSGTTQVGRTVLVTVL